MTHCPKDSQKYRMTHYRNDFHKYNITLRPNDINKSHMNFSLQKQISYDSFFG